MTFSSFNIMVLEPAPLSMLLLAVITKKCTFMMDMEGKAIPFSSSDASKLVSTVIEPMATDGLRTIGIAYKDFVIGDTQPGVIISLQ